MIDETQTEQARQRADAAAKDRTEAAKKHAEDTRKRLADERSAREAASKDNARMVESAKPTPTQEECDLAAEGVYLSEHEDDGSGPEPGSPLSPQPQKTGTAETKKIENKQSTADQPRGNYQTRSTTP